MKIEEAIAILERKTTIPGDGYTWEQIEEAIDAALTALRSMQEDGEPLNLEQLKQMDGKPVWIEDTSCWGLVFIPKAGQFKNSPFAMFRKEGVQFEWHVTDSELTIYSYPPAHIDRSEWISVKERLPDDEKDGETVLAVVSGKPHENITLCYALMTAGYFPGEGWVVNEYPEWENPTITHWMPLPKPPEEE